MEFDAKTPPRTQPSPTENNEDQNDDVFDQLPLLQEAAVTFIDDPYSALVVFQLSSSYVTINGNEESCGSSFSDSGTSLMASVHTSGFRFNPEPKFLEHLGLPPLINSQI